MRDIKEFKDDIDVLTSFEMLEHLQDPIGFLKSMSSVDCDKFVITVPYVSKSRVNLWKIDNPDNEVAFKKLRTYLNLILKIGRNYLNSLDGKSKRT